MATSREHPPFHIQGHISPTIALMLMNLHQSNMAMALQNIRLSNKVFDEEFT